ncbi:HGR050Wp [Eremothecium sinecaudum]|uniref:HGR050Wp n=1 Tax=Eremothecium sinecaudum TaxID=45286 RepID=A0A0X8HVV7_9SACH|nr:HGR050Wp [Eremothecium sinecaudum]AMD22389.1 HGR050Wp [Eremothecium sinecaudum]
MTDTLNKANTYIYDLNKDILDSLELMSFNSLVSEVIINTGKLDINEEQKFPDKTSLKKCNSCDIEFETDLLLKSHYREDFHRYNLRRKANGILPITFSEFENIMRNSDVESISGSDDVETSDNESDEDIFSTHKDQLDVIMENEIATLNSSRDNQQDSASHLNTRSPMLYLRSRHLSEEQVFGLYKCIFTPNTIQHPLDTLRKWQDNKKPPGMSALFMFGGGHFAGAIISHQRQSITGNLTKQGQSLQTQSVKLIEHKTFHRYTTRRKQGGSQSTMDNAKGKANSAGSSLRRYNEAALKNDIQIVIKQWEPYLSKCENIFIRAKNIADMKIFTESGNLKKDDPRIKKIPLTTKRPTTNEIKRVWCELTYLHITLRPQPVSQDKAVPSVVPHPIQQKKVEEVKELKLEEIHTKEVTSILKKSKAPQLLLYLKKHKLDVNFKLLPSYEYSQTPTMLHYASQNSLKNMVLFLLSNLKSDPTIKNEFGKTAWDLAKKIEVKRSFQIARSNLGESFTTWEDSNIGEPLTREQVAELTDKESKLEAEESSRAMERELEIVRERQRHKLESKRGPGKTLNDRISSNQLHLNSLSEDQRKRLMREQRARAAEARMKLSANK